MDKQSLADACNGIIFSLKKEENSDTWMNIENNILSEISQLEKIKTLILLT